MTNAEKRAHDIAVALISKREYDDIEDAVEDYKHVYFVVYDYIKEAFPEE